jgi:hypothetical protein
VVKILMGEDHKAQRRRVAPRRAQGGKDLVREHRIAGVHQNLGFIVRKQDRARHAALRADLKHFDLHGHSLP